jgi:hypothetical protein
MLTRPDSQTLQAIGDFLSEGIGRAIGDLARAIARMVDIRTTRPTRPARPTPLVTALIVALVTAAVVGIVATMWARNERIATLRRQDDERELELDAEAVERSADEGMTSVVDEETAEDDIVGIPIVDESVEREGVTTVA